MDKSKTVFLRRLNPMEEALTITANTFPLCVMTVLHLTNGPDSKQLQTALAELQRRHPLLQCSIERHERVWWFQKMSPEQLIPFEETEAKDRNTWQQVATTALNTRIPSSGPLMRCRLVNSAGKSDCELILCFHHAIVDAVTCRLLLHELLSICSNMYLLPSAAEAQQEIPVATKGWVKLLRFIAGMLLREWNYYRKGIRQTVPTHGQNEIISIQLTTDTSRKLTVIASRMGISLNAILMAALTRAVLQHQYPNNKKMLARLVSFVDLRENTSSSPEEHPLGCHVSMLPFETVCVPESSNALLAASIQKAIYKAGRRGDAVYLFYLARYMMKILVKKQNARLGLTALSFMGKLDLKSSYGNTVLREVSAFIPTNKLGPGFSAFGKTLFGALGLHITYLTAEITNEMAHAMAQEVKYELEELAKKA